MELTEVAYELARCIATDPRSGFESRAKELRRQYPNLTKQRYWYSIDYAFSKKDPTLVGETRLRKIQEFRSAIFDLCAHLNIPYDWAPEALYRFISPRGRYIKTSFRYLPVSITEPALDDEHRFVKFTVSIWPEATKSELDNKLEQIWAKVKDILAPMPKEKRTRAPSQLQMHIGWLYEVVVLGKTSGQVYDDAVNIPRPEGEEVEERWWPETIKREVNRLAKILRIQLRRGRPKKGSFI